jgi:GTPase-activating protein SAC7
MSISRLSKAQTRLDFLALNPPSDRSPRSFIELSLTSGGAGQNRGIFGVPLNVSIKYANVAISLTNDHGESFIYGYVPIVVAKCGVFLKEKATDVEGIFRLNGSARRIKDLQEIFDSPERYGKGLDWSGYTVHDAANVLRRYLNQLPEPIVPLNFYERFRDPLRHHQDHAAGEVDAKGESDIQQVVAGYQQFIRELPSLNQQLLLYILDLLAVFASKSDQNRMTSANLAAIFQPGILSHPTHDMAPEEYKLSQDVLIFLIENQDHFLFGMNGTADAQTVKELQGRAAPLGTRSSNLRRSASNASGGADSLRKYETLRRNVSVSSKNSRNSRTAQSPSTPTSNINVGVHRSNTVPSQKSPALPSSRLGRAAEPATPTSAGLTPPSDTHRTPRAGSQTPSRSPPVQYAAVAVVQYATDPPATMATVAAATPDRPAPPAKTSPSASQPVGTASSPPASSPPNVITHPKERKLSNFFKPPLATGESKEVRQPNRLKKQKIPGSTNESAQSSSNSLHATGDMPETPRFIPGITIPSHQHQPSESTLKPHPRSRTPSVSSFTDHSDLDPVDDAAKNIKKEHRQSWRFPLSPRRNNHDTLGIPSNPGAEFSTSSIGSSGRQRRSSANGLQPSVTDTSSPPSTQDAQSSEPEKRGLFGKFKAKVAHMKEGVKEWEAERERAKSPPKSDTEKTASSQNPVRKDHVSKDSKNGGRVSIDHPSEGIEDPPSSPPPQQAVIPTSPPAILEEPPSTTAPSKEPAPDPPLETRESTASPECAVGEPLPTPNASPDVSTTTASESELDV